MTRRRDGTGDGRLEELHAQLVTAVANLADGDEWRRMLTVAARFHRYSPNNVLLITVQSPGRDPRRRLPHLAVGRPASARRGEGHRDPRAGFLSASG